MRSLLTDTLGDPWIWQKAFTCFHMAVAFYFLLNIKRAIARAEEKWQRVFRLRRPARLEIEFIYVGVPLLILLIVLDVLSLLGYLDDWPARTAP